MANPQVKYSPLTAEEIQSELTEIEQVWKIFIEKYEKTPYKEFNVNKDDLIEVIERVDKRKDYYYYFHDIDNGNMSEYKEVALKCFWIVKLRPFRMENPISDLFDFVNERFGLYLIFCILHKELSESGHKLILPSKSFIKNIIYSLKYQDISKEAIIDMVEGFSENYVR
jgi:hypothetical protein